MSPLLSVHILEGASSQGLRYYACGRTVRPGGIALYIGRAKLTEHGDEVTCRACIRKYAMVLALIERARLDPDAPDAIAMASTAKDGGGAQ